MKQLICLLLTIMASACGNSNTKNSIVDNNDREIQVAITGVGKTAQSGERVTNEEVDLRDYVYDADWCKLPNMTMPAINTEKITGEFANLYNNEIKALYDNLDADFDWDAEKEGGHGPQSSYKWHVNSNVLSILLIYDHAGFSVGTDHFKSFHLDMKTGKPVSSDELIIIAGLTPEEIMDAVKKANNRAVINTENYNDYKTYYTEGVIEYESDHHYRNLWMYLGEEGLTIHVWVKNLPFGDGEFFIPFLPAQWRNAVDTAITLEEAVDILAKKLNDKTMKYLMEDDESKAVVDGENTYYIRAYHESLDGESIVTFGHFYIGRKSGKIYIMDIIMGTDIIPYEGSRYENL